MGQTMAEQLFSRKNKAGVPVKTGDFLEAKIDGAMCHYQFHNIIKHAVEDAGFEDGLPRVWDQEKVYMLMDHHQPPPSQALADRNKFLREQADKLGIKVFRAEPGISHQMMADYGYVRPGELVGGIDSHTIAYGALNAGGTGIANPETLYAVMFGELWFQVPETIKITLKGKQPNYPIAKDIILTLAGQYGDDFANGKSIEFDGSLVPQLSMDSRLCLATHGVEVAGKFAFFPADEVTHEFLKGRTDKPYEPLVADPDAEFVKEIELDVDEMPFAVAKPHQFGNVSPVNEVSGTKIDQAMIGSCANGRFEDIEIAARVLKGRQVAKGMRFIISPASQQVYLKCLEEGLVETLVEAGAQFIGPGCGICQPMVGFLSEGETCITSTTRNYRGRKGSVDADIYLGGPLTVAAAAIAGEIADPKEVISEL